MAGYKRSWCTWHYGAPVDDCPVSGSCRIVGSPLGEADEPQSSGAIVVVWAGDYRRQEIWVASGANVGNWYCLGNEFFRPKVWDDPRSYMDKMMDPQGAPERPAGTIPLQPTWYDILERGPVSALVAGDEAAYLMGWRNGRRELAAQVEELAEDDPADDGEE